MRTPSGPPRDDASATASSPSPAGGVYAQGSDRGHDGGSIADVGALTADLQLLTELQQTGCHGPLYDYFANELARYAYPVLLAWMRDGRIFAECAKKGRPVPVGMINFQGVRLWDHEDQEEIACLTIAYALLFFREQILLPGGWDPLRGASIRTFFTGACVLQFSNAYITVMKDRFRWHWMASEQTIEDVVARLPDIVFDTRGESPEDTAVQRAALTAVLDSMDDDLLRSAAMKILQGHTWTSAAAELGVTGGALSQRLRRFRERRRQQAGEGEA